MSKQADILVVGAGHAGVEAALCAARQGAVTLLVTMNCDKIAAMSCNPAIGGLGKAHLVRDLDALGGEMAKAIDATGIQFRMLNTKKGPAVWSLRAQADLEAYRAYMTERVYSTPNLRVLQAEAADLLVQGDRVYGVRTLFGQELRAGAVIMCCGTFLAGRIFIGQSSYPAGRAWEFPANSLAENLYKRGLLTGRLKTGTPARLWGPSIDYSKLSVQHGDERIRFFSFETGHTDRPQIDCYMGYTNERVHAIIRENLHTSPLYGSKLITGVGPRYCPSIETKVVRFPQRQRHQIFFEPMSPRFHEIYANGISTSLPLEVQYRFYRAIEGLEQVEFIKPAYAIEYAYLNPVHADAGLKVKQLQGLYYAGQVLGTSGYEEAAAQGFMAACNALRALDGKEPFVLGRGESYIGVMINDLITKGVDEPYRMFTSRAEFRLLLRLDNAEDRLLAYGRRLGLISDQRWQAFAGKQAAEATLLAAMERIRLPQTQGGKTIQEWLKQPGADWRDVSALLPHMGACHQEVMHKLAVRIKYQGYIAREQARIGKWNRLQARSIPREFDFMAVRGLSNEARQKLAAARPGTLAEAAAIPGITPAAIQVLLVALQRAAHRDSADKE